MPIHFFVLLIIAYCERVTIGTFFSNLFFFNSGMNYVTWSLTYEWVFYVSLVLIMYLRLKFKKLELLNVNIALGFILILIGALAEASVARTMCFIFGIFLYKNTQKIKSNFFLMSKAALVSTFFLILVFLVTWATYSSVFSKLQTEIFYLLVAGNWALLLAVLIANKKLQSLFANKYVFLVGEASYSFYLIHHLVIEFLTKSIFPVTSLSSLLWMYPVVLTVTVAISLLLYNMIELKSMTYLSKY